MHKLVNNDLEGKKEFPVYILQMTNEMAKILRKGCYVMQSRGMMRVKGVLEPIETFFLELDSKRNSAISLNS